MAQWNSKRKFPGCQVHCCLRRPEPRERTVLLPRLWSTSLLCQGLPEQPSSEQQRCCVQERQRSGWPCFQAVKRSLRGSGAAVATGGPAPWFWAPFAAHTACCQWPNAGLQAVVGAALCLGVLCPGRCSWVDWLQSLLPSGS